MDKPPTFSKKRTQKKKFERKKEKKEPIPGLRSISTTTRYVLTHSLTFCGASPLDSGRLCAGGLAALGGGGVAENACAAAATRPKFTAGACSPSFAVALRAGGGRISGKAAAATDAADAAAAALFPLAPDPPLPALVLLAARLSPAASARDVAGLDSARWAAVMAAVAAAAGCVSVESGSPAPPTRERRSGLDAKYLERARIGSAVKDK
jgi:hypothetical protein